MLEYTSDTFFIAWDWVYGLLKPMFPYSIIVLILALYIFRKVFIYLRLYITALNPFYGRIGRVIRCSDGDTIVIGNPNRKSRRRRTKVRFIGVDTPESTRSLYQDVMPFGKEAAEYTKSRLKRGKRVFLYYDKESRDKFGRVLAYVYLSNGEFFNATLVKKGYAFAKEYPPNTKYSRYFRKLERKAKRKRRGLWKMYASHNELLRQYKRTNHYKSFKRSYTPRKARW